MDVTASTITVITSAWTLARHVKDLIAHIHRHEENAKKLEHEAETLQTIVEEVYRAYGPEKNSQDQIHHMVGKVIARLEQDLEHFRDELAKLLNDRKDGPLRPGWLLRTWREEVAAPVFSRLEKSISSHQYSLHILVSLLHGRKVDALLAEVQASNERTIAVFQAFAPLIPLHRRNSDETLVAATESNDVEYQADIAAQDPTGLQQHASRFLAAFTEIAAEQGLSKPSHFPFHVQGDNGGRRKTSIGSMSALDTKVTNWQNGDIYGKRQKDRRSSSSTIAATIPEDPFMPIKTRPPDVFLKYETDSPELDQSLRTLWSEPSRTKSVVLTTSSSAQLGSRRSTRTRQTSIPAMIETTSGVHSEQPVKGMELLRAIQEDREDRVDELELILKGNVNLEDKDDKDRTPLLVATVKDKPCIVAMLLAHNADIGAKDSSQKTALHLACEMASFSVVSSLLSPDERGGNPRPFPKFDVNAIDRLGRTPLHYCAERDMVDGIRLLMDYGADINVKDKGDNLPLYFAIQKRNYATVQLLGGRQAIIDDKCQKLSLETSYEIKKLLKRHGIVKNSRQISFSRTLRRMSTA